MALDLALLAVVAVCGLSGLVSGAIRQLTHWAGMAAGYLLAGRLAARLTPALVARLHWPAAGVRAGLGAVLFCVVAAAAATVVHWTLAHLAVEDGRLDHGGGFVLGAAKGALLSFAALSLLLVFEKPLVRRVGPLPAGVAGSRVLAYARGHNLLSAVPLPLASRLERLADAADSPRASRAALEPELRSLLDDPALKALLRDDALRGALRSGELASLEKDPRLAALLRDPRLAGETGAR